MTLWRVLDYTKLNADIAEIIFDLGFDWRKERDSLRDIISLRLLSLYSSYTSLIFIISLSLSLAKKHIYMMKGKTGIQPFPASGSPTAGFSLPLKCERRQQVAAYSSSEFPPIKKDTQGVCIKGIQPFPASGNFINCSEGIRSATFRLLLVLNFIFILTLIFCHNVAITPGLQTTVSSVVWSARSP